MRYAGDYRLIFVVLVFGTLLLGFKHMLAGLLCPPGSVTDILQFFFALVFSQSTKAQCSADLCGFSSYACAVVQMHPLGSLPVSVLWHVRIGEIFLEEWSVGVGGAGGLAGEDSQLEAAAGNQERSPIPHEEELIPVLAQHPARSLPSPV